MCSSDLVLGTRVLTWLLCSAWGLAFVVQKLGLDDADPLWFATARTVTAAVALLPALAVGAPLGRRGHVTAALLGLTNVTLFLGLQVAGLDHVDSGTAAAVVFTQPLIVLLLTFVLTGERSRWNRVSGLTIALLGIFALGLSESLHGSLLGVAELLGAALAWACGTVLLGRSGSLEIWKLIAAQNLYGCLPLLALTLAFQPSYQMTPRLVGSVLYVGVIATAASWLVLALLLRRSNTADVTSSLVWVPVCAAVFAVVLGHEALRPLTVAGITMVVFGSRIT